MKNKINLQNCCTTKFTCNCIIKLDEGNEQQKVG